MEFSLSPNNELDNYINYPVTLNESISTVDNYDKLDIYFKT